LGAIWKKTFIRRPSKVEKKQMNHMSQENPVQKKSNTKVIALAIVCVILAASLVGVIAIYLPNGNPADLKAQIADKDSTISSLQTQIAALQYQLSQTANASDASVYVNQIAYLNQELTELNDQVTGYYNIAIMNTSSSLVYQQPITQDANSSTAVFSDAIYYAGYVVVQATATANTTYAEVLYSYAGANFDFTQTLGTSGTATFPVLPGTLQINIGNTNQTTTNSITATVTYYY
jgi:flagellar basal body-associated protein FliL